MCAGWQSLYNMLGEAYFKLERVKEAEHWYREALRVKADHIPAHLTYGKLLTKMVRMSQVISRRLDAYPPTYLPSFHVLFFPYMCAHEYFLEREKQSVNP